MVVFSGMAQDISALCYFNGTITKGPQGVDYEGSFSKAVTISSNWLIASWWIGYAGNLKLIEIGTQSK